MIAGINLSGKPPFNGWLFCFYPNNPQLDPRPKRVRADFPFGCFPRADQGKYGAIAALLLIYLRYAPLTFHLVAQFHCAAHLRLCRAGL